MSDYVLINLFNKLRKMDKIQGLLSILLLFCNKFNVEHSGSVGRAFRLGIEGLLV